MRLFLLILLTTSTVRPFLLSPNPLNSYIPSHLSSSTDSSDDLQSSLESMLSSAFPSLPKYNPPPENNTPINPPGPLTSTLSTLASLLSTEERDPDAPPLLIPPPDVTDDYPTATTTSPFGGETDDFAGEKGFRANSPTFNQNLIDLNRNTPSPTPTLTLADEEILKAMNVTTNEGLFKSRNEKVRLGKLVELSRGMEEVPDDSTRPSCPKCSTPLSPTCPKYIEHYGHCIICHRATLTRNFAAVNTGSGTVWDSQNKGKMGRGPTSPKPPATPPPQLSNQAYLKSLQSRNMTFSKPPSPRRLSVTFTDGGDDEEDSDYNPSMIVGNVTFTDGDDDSEDSDDGVSMVDFGTNESDDGEDVVGELEEELFHLRAYTRKLEKRVEEFEEKSGRNAARGRTAVAWEKMWDEESGAEFWMNRDTGEVKWKVD